MSKLPKIAQEVKDAAERGVPIEKISKAFGYKPEVIEAILSFGEEVDGGKAVDDVLKSRNDKVLDKLFGSGKAAPAPVVNDAAAIGQIIAEYNETDPTRKFGERVEAVTREMAAKGEKYAMSANVPENMKNLTCIGGVCLAHQRAGNKFAGMKGVTVKNKNYEKEGLPETIEYNPSFWDNADKLGYNVFELDDLSKVQKGDIIGKYGKAYDGSERMMHSNIVLEDGGGKGPTDINQGRDMMAYDSYQATNNDLPIGKYAYRGGEKNGKPVTFKVARIKAERAAEIEGEDAAKNWKRTKDWYMQLAAPILKQAPDLYEPLMKYGAAVKAGNGQEAAAFKQKIAVRLRDNPQLLIQLFPNGN
jgi:hypothetical protein